MISVDLVLAASVVAAVVSAASSVISKFVERVKPRKIVIKMGDKEVVIDEHTSPEDIRAILNDLGDQKSRKRLTKAAG